MKIFIFGKEAARIRADARAAERHICDAHYLKEQEKMRKQYTEDRDALNKAHVRELKEKEIEFLNKYDMEIKRLRAEIAKKDTQLRNAQQAWELFKGFLPEVKNCASFMETKAHAVALERSRDLALARENDDMLAGIMRKLAMIEPDMNKLLSYDDTSIGVKK